MFLEFYGLKEQPFGVTPDPRFLYMSPSHREALASLYCSIENNRGFSAMVAPPGMGKTSLLFRLLQNLRQNVRTAFLFHPDKDVPQFFQSLLLDVGLEGSPADFVKMRDSLNRMLLEERRSGRRFVLVVDEAQNLSPEILECVRLLSNFETPEEKLIHIILSGQPQLAETLQRPEMCQLSQRISTIIALHPFSNTEVIEYIHHRLSMAGRCDRSPFTDEALDLIAQESRGIPRNINSLCFQALSIGAALRKPQVDAEVLHELLLDARKGVQQANSVSDSPSIGVKDWQDTPLREDSFGRVHFVKPKKNVLGLTAAVAATAVLSAGFWTAAVPRIKTYRDLNALTETKTNKSTQAPANQSAQQIQEEAKNSDTVKPQTQPNTQSNAAPDTDSADPRREVTDDSGIAISGKAALDSARRSRVRDNSKPFSKRVFVPGGSATRVVFANRQESLFQVALDNYGESSSLIVDKILLANPQFHNRDAIINQGQKIVLPGLTKAKVSPNPVSANIKRD